VRRTPDAGSVVRRRRGCRVMTGTVGYGFSCGPAGR
jgi:hypothetical protein